MAPDPIPSSPDIFAQQILQPSPAPQQGPPMVVDQLVRVDPTALEALATKLITSAADAEALQTEPPLNDAASAVPGSDTARACSEIATALTASIRGVSGRMEEMARIAKGSKEDYEVAESAFTSQIESMAGLL